MCVCVRVFSLGQIGPYTEPVCVYVCVFSLAQIGPYTEPVCVYVCVCVRSVLILTGLETKRTRRDKGNCR